MLAGRRYYVTGRTREECARRLRELVQRHQAGQLLPPSRITLQEWAETWLKDCEGRLRPRTVLTYRQALLPLLATVGQLRLDRLEPLHLARTFATLQGRVGSRTLEQGYIYLRACLEAARRMGLVAHNPLARTPRPRHEKAPARDWTLDDMRRFLATCLEDGKPLALMLGLMLLTGLRPGEALGLRWEDVDWDGQALRVRRAVAWAGSTWHEGPPKSRAGERTVALPTLALGLLPRLPRVSVHLFWQERPPTRKQVSYQMGELCGRANVPRKPAHYLRHCHATLLAAQGLDIKTLQRRLGHAQASITLDVYAYTLSDLDKRAAELVDKALG